MNKRALTHVGILLLGFFGGRLFMRPEGEPFFVLWHVLFGLAVAFGWYFVIRWVDES